MSEQGNGNGEQGVRVSGKVQLVLEYDYVTHQVTIGGAPMQISLAQMIVGEGMRLLEEQRRVAAAIQLQAQMKQAAADQALVAGLRKDGKI